MMGWASAKLSELCDRITVGHVGSMASRYVNSGIPFLRSQNIKKGYVDLSGVKYIDAKFHEELRKSQLFPGDLVIVRTGEPGTTAIIPDDMGPMNCADVVIATPKPGVNRRFLCYAINQTAQHFVQAHTVGAVQQHFNVRSAKEMTLALPDLVEQEAIVSVLRALDDKIAVNDRIIHTAEELMVALIDRAGSGVHVKLQELCSLRKNLVSPSEIPDSQVDYYSLPAFDERKVPQVVAPDSIKSSKFLIKEPSVLISKLNPRFPRVWSMRPRKDVPSLASTEFLVLVPREGISSSHLWAITSRSEFFSNLASRVTGTSNSHQRVKPAEILNSEVVDPRGLGADLTLIDGLAARANNCLAESQVLAKLRNTLLPRLMSGEIRVKDAEKIVEEAT